MCSVNVHTMVAGNQGMNFKCEWRGKLNWQILAMSGVLSRPHIDAGGVGTMIEVLFGIKAWAIYTGNKPLEDFDFTAETPDLEDWDVIILRPGDKLYARAHPFLSLTLPDTDILDLCHRVRYTWCSPLRSRSVRVRFIIRSLPMT